MVRTLKREWIVLVGVGINVTNKDFPPEIANSATSLFLEGISVDSIPNFAEKIMVQLYQFGMRREMEGFAPILQDWRSYDQTQSRVFEAIVEGETIEGVANGVDHFGRLLLCTKKGDIIAVSSATSR